MYLYNCILFGETFHMLFVKSLRVSLFWHTVIGTTRCWRPIQRFAIASGGKKRRRVKH